MPANGSRTKPIYVRLGRSDILKLRCPCVSICPVCKFGVQASLRRLMDGSQQETNCDRRRVQAVVCAQAIKELIRRENPSARSHAQSWLGLADPRIAMAKPRNNDPRRCCVAHQGYDLGHAPDEDRVVFNKWWKSPATTTAGRCKDDRPPAGSGRTAYSWRSGSSSSARHKRRRRVEAPSRNSLRGTPPARISKHASKASVRAICSWVASRTNAPVATLNLPSPGLAC